MQVNAIIQARMSSQRLPAKVLMPAEGKAMLEWLLLRLKATQTLSKIILATSNDPTDDKLYQFCLDHKLTCERGDLNNVAQRFANVIQKHPAEYFVRINADSPFYDASLMDKAIDLAFTNGFDLVTNVFPRSYPKGFSVEVIKSATFLEICKQISTNEEKEHCTQYFYKNPKKFKIHNFKSETDHSNLNLSVDSPQDFESFCLVLKKIKHNFEKTPYQEIIEHFKQVSASKKT